MKRVLTSIICEPLVHFTLLAGALFAANYWFAPDDRETIAVTPAMVDELVRRDQQFQPGAVSDERRQELIESFIEDEILVRDAYRRGLDRDAIVRQHLTMKMRLLLSEEVDDPTSAELRAYFEQNKQKYRVRPTLGLEHVFYQPGVSPDSRLLEKLQEGADPTKFGEPLGSLGRNPRAYSERDLAFYTDADFARRVFALPIDAWTGPIESSRGVHFVRVVEKQPAGVAEFETLESYLREDWKFSKVREGVSKRIDEMRNQYNIIVEPGQESKP